MKLVKMDKQGRIVLPSVIRKKLRAKRFEIELKGDFIELRPARSLNSLFGVLPKLDLKKIREEHGTEVKNEHFSVN